MSETPGQKACRLVNEAKQMLDDPTKAAYHDRLRAAIGRMEHALDFWRQLDAVLADAADHPGGLRQEFERARQRQEQVPPWARPYIVRKIGGLDADEA